MVKNPKSLHGRSLIGFSLGEDDTTFFQAENPATGQPLEPKVHAAGAAELDQAVGLAVQAYRIYGQTGGLERAQFLRAIAQEIENIGNDIVERAMAETGLGEGRIRGEIARTTGQLRLFSDLVEEGSWVDARIDLSAPDRLPLPKPDIRSMLGPIGPVAVFCASNFPIAFSVAGGDTASALAAGNPVLVKAHPAHPGTAELVGRAILLAVQKCDLPDGTFSLLQAPSHEFGREMAMHPGVKAVAFTGSRQGGRALFDAAGSRPEPIPVYAEMSSINPIFLLRGALGENGRLLAEQFHASLMLGVGQFCTNPGVVVLPAGEVAERFRIALSDRIRATPTGVMLQRGIRRAYVEGVARWERSGATPLAAGETDGGAEGCLASPVAFTVDVETFLGQRVFSEEVFGPACILVETSSSRDQERLAESLEGQLTASIFGTEEEVVERHRLLAILRGKVGRLLFNQFPTGVEVCHSMVHGGPYPATSDGRSTSVGTAAIHRFVRPVCYQNFPDKLLPPELRAFNPLGIWRKVDGALTK